jgi:uncharacterized protein YabE (DUF348 family)
MIGKLSGWFKGLSQVGRAAVIGGVGIGLVTIASVSANNDAVITTKTETENISIPFETTYQDDDSLLTSETQIVSPGVEGNKDVTYKVTYKNGKESKREVVTQQVKKQPITQISKRGTKEMVNIEVTEPVAFGVTTINNSSMDKGASVVTTAGVNGSKIVTYEVTKVRGQEVARKAVKETVTTQPVAQVTSIGTKAAAVAKASSNCDPNYSGACVPIASDVDCGNGSGNGPAYVYGTVRVIGSDIYGLDRDGDGYGCE